jgi:probable rRNA maturation factor
MALINFYGEDVAVPTLFDQKKIAKGLKAIAKNHNSKIENLNYIFCSDEYLLDINKTYLDHDYYTDIITFPYQQGSIIEGDIFISIDRVSENALFEKVDPLVEYYRVISHGLLHLIGYKDKTDDDQQKMTAAEDLSISIIEQAV